ITTPSPSSPSVAAKCSACDHQIHALNCPSCACTNKTDSPTIDNELSEQEKVKLICVGHYKLFSEFCTRCKALCCQTCSSELHSNCSKYLLSIDDAANKIQKELLSQKTDLQDFKSCIVKCMLDLNNIGQLKDKQKNDVETMYNDVFDKIVKAVESKKQQLRLIIDKDSDDIQLIKDLEQKCNHELRYISEQMDLIDNSLEDLENKQLFFSRYLKCNNFRDLKTDLEHIETAVAQCSDYQLSHEKSKNFDLLIQEFVSKLCPLVTDDESSLEENLKEQLLSAITYLKPQRILKYSTNLENEKVFKKFLNDMIIFNDGCIVLSDSFNSKLKLFSSSGHLACEYKLEYWPFGLSLWNEDMFVVSLPNVRKICFVKHMCPMSLSHYIATKWSYYCLAKLDDCHLVCTHSCSSKIDIVRVEDKYLSLIRSIEPDTHGGITNSICYVAVTPTSDIVISDHHNECLSCYSRDGICKFLIKYIGKHPLDGPAGVCADDQFIYLSEMGRSRVLRLNFNGVLNGVLLPKEINLVRPKAISIGPNRTIGISNFTNQQSFIQIFQI
ncbi:hypothetical protein Ahia01_000621500, partial [Argonauta hians]